MRGRSMYSIIWDDVRGSDFRTGTYPYLLIDCIEKQTSPYVLIIQSDGEISNFNEFCTYLRGRGSVKLELCRGMYVLFSKHTTVTTKNAVQNQLTEILSSVTQTATPFEFVLDDPRRNQIIGELITRVALWQANSSYQMPNGSLIWDDMIFNRNITKYNLAKQFKFQSVLLPYIEKFCKQVKSLLTTNAEKATMLQYNLAYARLYGTFMMFWGQNKDSCSLYDQFLQLKAKNPTSVDDGSVVLQST